jgi:hypothetical protein
MADLTKVAFPLIILLGLGELALGKGRLLRPVD